MKRMLWLLWALALLGAAAVNSGARHETASALSAQAEAYYAEACDFAALCALPGSAGEDPAELLRSPLCAALHTLMNDTRTHLPSYAEALALFSNTDASRDSQEPLRFYCEDCGSYNREQVWPDALGNFYQSGAGCDLHQLRPADPQANLARGSRSFGKVRDRCADCAVWSAQDGRPALWYSESWNGGGGLAEPRDEVKGDVARILLYVFVTWGDPDGRNLNLWTDQPVTGSGLETNLGRRVIENLDTLLEWMALDPVDSWELSRNDVVQSIQGSRNVFIDYPELAFLLFDREIPEMETPSGWAAGLYASLSAVASPAEGGSLSVADWGVEAVPAPGWCVSGWSLEPADAAELDWDGNLFLLRALRKNCTLCVYFALSDPCAQSHLWDEGSVIREATQTRPGEILYRCQRCGAERREALIFRFEDVMDESLYFFAPVYWALQRTPPITNGTDETHFAPALACSRAQVVTFLWRAAGCPQPTLTELPFLDVSADAYYADAVRWAAERGITNGTSPVAFSPNLSCTRGQIVSFLWKAAGCPAPAPGTLPFADVKSGAYYQRAVLWATQQGIVLGVSPEHFAPNAACTRAQVVTFLWRAAGEEE